VDTAIRLIGDPVLHCQGCRFPDEPTTAQWQELERQVGIAKSSLIAAGGVGIAANQCAAIAEPYQLIIVGIFHDNARHTATVRERYPDIVFPEALLMINPDVQTSSGSTTFRHRCLSVPGQICAEMATPQAISVSYLTPDGSPHLQSKTETLKGMDAVVLQHELNHILGGKTYLDCCFEQLDAASLAQLKTALQQAKTDQEPPDHPSCLVSVNQSGQSELEDEALDQLVDCVDASVLAGIQARL
jgi:peptide deformylase